MLRDARNIEQDGVLDFDVCVVGGGAAGITLALELDRTGARVCVLEAGGVDYEASSQALLDGEVLAEAYPPLTDTRFSALGGSTKLWAGWCRPLDGVDFEERSWVANSGWPFEREALNAAYRRAHEICGLADFDYGADSWRLRGKGEPLALASADLTTSVFHVSPLQFGKAYGGALRSASNIHVLLHAIVLRLRTGESAADVEAAQVGTLSGRTFEVRARLFVLTAGGIENARLLMLSGDSPERALGNAHGLVGRFFSDHPFLNPGYFVATAPSLSLDFYSPRAAVRMPRLAEGSATVSDEPGGRSASRAAVRAAISLTPGALQRARVLNGALFPKPAYEAHPAFRSPEVQALLRSWEPIRGRGVPGHVIADLRSALRAPTKAAVAIWRRFSVTDAGASRWPIRAFFECESRAENRVWLSDRRDAKGRRLPKIEWRLSDLDVHSMRHAWRTLDQALRGSGLGRLELAFPDEPGAWRAAAEGGKHHMGTTRMHTDPRRGVVDSDCRVHGTSNLYVAGSSVFPTPGFANPTLTIVALAVRLASHLAARLP
jgi:choline dehydrogenase-like flavoprotein